MSMFYIAILLFGGMIFARLFSKIKFPEVTGFLIAGIIIGPSVLNLIPKDGVKSLEILSNVALSFIAFSIGAEMKLSVLKKLGSKIALITVFEALGALVVVLLGCLFIFKMDFPFSITLASIACATAPAATLMVIREYRAKGELVDVLLPVVALDDAVCIIAFGICSSLAVNMLKGSDMGMASMLVEPILDIVLSIVIGLVGGFLYSLVAKRVKTENELLSLIIATVFMLASLADMLGLSGLLTLMSASVLISNISVSPRRYFDIVDRITPPIFMCFFVLSGADLNLAGLKSVGLIGVFYIFGRVLGKYLGAFSSSKITGMSKKVQRYLGLTLVPQAGVAIGLSLIASQEIPEPHGSMIRTVILGATIVYELFGPLLAKFALTQADCIVKKS
ncbi:cation:proton antiporter [Peptoniphilus catoniae]|uniref:cation:proton antiporter n=1 Tax=Peptoniphilus catoniae TaxID=1660341 RepID=UPI0010FCED90|nr:cation:proton antiporter [Peptoniphilus catoniae]